MFQLCGECRNALNFSEAESSEPVPLNTDLQGPRDVGDVAARCGGSDVVVGDGLLSLEEDGDSEAAGDEVLSSGSEGGPSCKRSRVEESSPNTNRTSSQGESEGMGATDVPEEEPDTEDAPFSVVGGVPASDEVALGDETFAGDKVSVRTNAPVCSGCLGLLDERFVTTLTSDIHGELVKANYEGLKTFSLSISTPLSLIIRRCGVLFYLKENFEIMDELTLPPEAFVKENLRHKLYSQLKKKLDPLKSDVASPFQIVLKLDHSSSTTECRLAAETWPDAFNQPKKIRRKYGKGKTRTSVVETIFNTNNINRALTDATARDFEKRDFLSAVKPCTYTIEFTHSSLFVGGRYCKYSRDLPQTPWFIGDVRKAATSVQELICDHICEVARSSEVKFSSSGREDCDVRMLGNGRPFLVELLNPRKTELERSEVETLQSKINSSTKLVEVKRLQVMTKSAAVSLKEGEQEKRKEYRALVWAPEKVTKDTLDVLGAMTDTVIHQKTPIRVLHRRSLATRDRTIHKMSAELVNDHHFYLLLTTQAGTYVKEFVHGDFGRTQPNLRSIMGQAVDILTLDVCEVLLDWPKQQQP